MGWYEKNWQIYGSTSKTNHNKLSMNNIFLLWWFETRQANVLGMIVQKNSSRRGVISAFKFGSTEARQALSSELFDPCIAAWRKKGGLEENN